MSRKTRGFSPLSHPQRSRYLSPPLHKVLGGPFVGRKTAKGGLERPASRLSLVYERERPRTYKNTATMARARTVTKTERPCISP